MITDKYLCKTKRGIVNSNTFLSMSITYAEKNCSLKNFQYIFSLDQKTFTNKNFIGCMKKFIQSVLVARQNKHANYWQHYFHWSDYNCCLGALTIVLELNKRPI